MTKTNYTPQEIYQLHQEMGANFKLEPGTRISFHPADGCPVEFEHFLYEKGILCVRDTYGRPKNDAMIYYQVEYPDPTD